MSKITKSAKGQPCTIRLFMGCDQETTVFAHIQRPGHGKVGSKPIDLHGAYACARCHDAIDRRGSEWREIDRYVVESRKLAGMIETQLMLIDARLLNYVGQPKFLEKI